MPILNITQQQFLFFIIGAFIGFMQPISAVVIGITMVVLGWKNLTKTNLNK